MGKIKNILVISPHPDDESIGCGGAIRLHTHAGDIVEVIFLTSGEKGCPGVNEEEVRKIREREARTAADILGIFKVHFWLEPDGQFEASPNNLTRLLEKITLFKPDIIYVPHENEGHPDHRAAAVLIKQAFAKLERKENIPVVLMYEVWTPIQRMDHIIDISDYVNLKRKAILAHKSQCDLMKFDEAILGLNRYRGEMNSVSGGDYAEVFVLM